MKNKRSYFVLAIIAILCMSLCLAGCGKKETSDKGNNGSGIEKMDSTEQDQGQQQKTASSEDTKKKSSSQEIKYTEKIKASEATPKPSAKLSEAAKEYADYCAMSSDEQYAYYKTFKSADDFMNWYNKAKAKYEKENPTVVLEPGAVIDLGN